jgi:hypothetical protein
MKAKAPPMQLMQARQINPGNDMVKHLLLFVITAVLATFNHPVDAREPVLGRLFTTPEERERLDLLRKQGGAEPIATLAAKEVPHPPAADLSTLDGYVTRSSGKTTTWVNQIAHDENDQTKSVMIWQKPNRAPEIYLQTQSGKRVNVNVGDTLNLKTGTVRKVYERADNDAPVTDKKP